jgi:DNA-binding MarR family transcriptional regulator
VATRPVSVAEYRALATFRYELRRFLRFSEDAARRVGLEPRQHQLMLAVRGMPDGAAATVGVLAERLQLRHHSVVELIDRSEAKRLVRRTAAGGDRRRVAIELTPRGERVLGRLAAAHRAELRAAGGRLIVALHAVVGEATRVRGDGRRGRAA